MVPHPIVELLIDQHLFSIYIINRKHCPSIMGCCNAMSWATSCQTESSSILLEKLEIELVMASCFDRTSRL